ncbi:MAG TPA: OmpA family protein [Polyangiaceae bacterium]
MKKTLFVSFAAVFCLAVAGCNSATEPTTKVAGLDKPADPPKMPDLGHGAPRSETDQMYNLWLAPGVASICSGPSPFFAFDSSKPDTESQPTMQNLVDCMRTGPLQGKSIILIGRTDPRGSDDYNIKLGRDRAERVKKYLVANGIDQTRVMTDSIGKRDAHDDPKEWPGDRRVQIELAGPNGTTVSMAEKH